MARFSWLLFPATLLLVFGACGPEDVDKPEAGEEQAEAEHDELPAGADQSQAQDDPEQVKQDVLADVWEKVMQKSAAEPKLPRDLETGDRYLTARVTANPEGYEVFYYLMEEPVPVNDAQLEQKDPYLTVSAIVYDTAEGARAGVDYEPERKAGQPADLGHGITGYMDAGAGSIGLVWHEGRWSFLIHERNGEDAGEEMVGQAKEIVKKLEEKMLPAPQEVGSGTFDMTGDGASAHSLQWQAENVVYTVHFGEPLELIDIVAKMNE
ncbi:MULTISPECIES: hypothetical protein [Bhargavaea]|uniref:DUF4367 domain-containing protein n=1 Tax=Bhargavaea changchunensis TaxID=2134037 RepID=A0ABW2NJA0_9BACL|nr:hypothetical protein [Bhargavaea sp. CC-171006]